MLSKGYKRHGTYLESPFCSDLLSSLREVGVSCKIQSNTCNLFTAVSSFLLISLEQVGHEIEGLSESFPRMQSAQNTCPQGAIIAESISVSLQIGHLGFSIILRSKDIYVPSASFFSVSSENILWYDISCLADLEPKEAPLMCSNLRIHS